MYRSSILPIIVFFSAIILSGCSKSTEPQTQRPPYFTSTGIGYPSWHDTGFPEGVLPELSSSEKMNCKTKVYFYNHLPSDVLLNNILSQVPEGYTGDEGVPVLDVTYDPSLKGTYNYSPNLSDPVKCWGGLQRLVSQDEIKEGLASYQIQIWMKIQQAPKGAKLYIDLGRINEDVIPNGRFDNEDKNCNGLLDFGEDTGLDGLTDKQEPNYNEVTNPDPSGDNYSYSPGSSDYSQINGTESNAVSLDNGKLPDSEDMDGNLFLDQRNDFLRYEISLDSLEADYRYTVEKGRNGWFKIMIPLSAYKEGIGYPVLLSPPMIMRLWFSGSESRIHLRFAEMGLISL